MQRDFAVADASERLSSALERLHQGDSHALPVLRDGRFAGVITMEGIGELVHIGDALRVHGLADAGWRSRGGGLSRRRGGRSRSRLERMGNP